MKKIIILLSILFLSLNTISGGETKNVVKDVVKDVVKYDPGQLVQYIDSKKVGILTGTLKGNDGKYKPFYEVGLEINIINFKDNKPGKIYMMNMEGKKFDYKKGEAIVLYDVHTNKSNIIMTKSIKPFSSVCFDIFNNITVPIFPVVGNLPNLAIGAGISSGSSSDSCLGYILVGTCQAYISNISQTAGTSAVANNYTVGWINSGSCFVVYDAVVQIK